MLNVQIIWMVFVLMFCNVVLLKFFKNLPIFKVSYCSLTEYTVHIKVQFLHWKRKLAVKKSICMQYRCETDCVRKILKRGARKHINRSGWKPENFHEFVNPRDGITKLGTFNYTSVERWKNTRNSWSLPRWMKKHFRSSWALISSIRFLV